jgi:hypothetical protein
MLSSSSVVAILALASSALAHPQPAVTGTKGDRVIASTLGTAIGGALQVEATAKPKLEFVKAIASPPEYLTIEIINMHGDAISTSHAHAQGGPMAVSGNVGPGTMAKGETAAFALPTGWAGNVAINDAGSEITGDDSLIEASFVIPDSSYSVAVVDVDVSYVNGFSVAIVCSCNGEAVSGCNKNLDDLNSCPVRMPLVFIFNPILALSHPRTFLGHS